MTWLAVLLLAGGVTGCQAAPAESGDAATGSPDSGASPVPDLTREVPGGVIPTGMRAIARVEPGIYARDPRFQRLAEEWDDHVGAALDRLEDGAGLVFEGPPPRVVLTPLGDETRPHEVRTGVIRGRRRAVVRVGAEGLVSGVREVQPTLVRALCQAIFEVSAQTHGVVPAWVPALAGVMAAEDEAGELDAIHHDLALGDPNAARIDKHALADARATGLALRFVLEDRVKLSAAARLLSFAVDGDDAEWMLTRLLEEPDASWIGPAREALRSRLMQLDASPYQVLLDAQSAWATTGRGGLEASLPNPVPDAIQGEVKLLLARAAATEGDWSAARGHFGGLTPEMFVALRDPGAALALRVDIATRSGTDGDRIGGWLDRLDRDFPKNAARAALYAGRPTLGFDDDPVGWLARMRTRIERGGSERLDLKTLGRVLRVLLVDHRAGAAGRLVHALGARADAPELASVVRAVAESEVDPTAAARSTNARRVERWLAAPSPETRQHVADGGRAAWDALIQRLPPSRAPGRAEGGRFERGRATVVALLVETGGVARTSRALAAQWNEDADAISTDLTALSAGAPVFEVRDAILDLAPRVLSRAQAESAWARTSFRIERVWLDAHPRFLIELHDPAYAVRRAAFDSAADDGRATPDLVGHALTDDAVLLRQRAAEVAGSSGYAALTREALRDPAAVVREAATLALGKVVGRSAIRPLIDVLRTDPAPSVRVAAAAGLTRLAPDDPTVVRALVATQADPSSAVRDPVGTVLQAIDGPTLARALSHALGVEAAARPLRRPVIARLIVLFQRIAGRDLGYTPDAGRRTIRGLSEQMARWAARQDQIEADIARLGGTPKRPGR